MCTCIWKSPSFLKSINSKLNELMISYERSLELLPQILITEKRNIKRTLLKNNALYHNALY